MNKKEAMELKRSIKSEDFVIDTLVTAFVRHDENGKPFLYSFNRQGYSQIEEEERFKYVEFCKNVLTGKFEKNLLNVELDSSDMSKQDQLLNLRDNALENDEQDKTFILNMAENYEVKEHLFVMLISAKYEVPKKATDGAVLEDETDTYSYILCSINPIKLEKAGICYSEAQKRFIDLPQKLVVDKPLNGFLYPAFNDRAADVNSLVFFTKKADNIHNELIKMLTGNIVPLSAEEQKDIFEDIIMKVSGEDVSYETMESIYTEVAEKIETRKMTDSPTDIGKEEIKDILRSCGVEEKHLSIDEAYDSRITEEGDVFNLENLVADNKFDIGVGSDVTIKVAPGKSHLVEKRRVDGAECFVIPITGKIELNGTEVTI